MTERNYYDTRISDALSFNFSIESMANIAIVVSLRSMLCIFSRIVAAIGCFVFNSHLFFNLLDQHMEVSPSFPNMQFKKKTRAGIKSDF